jgi:hypothetical protein
MLGTQMMNRSKPTNPVPRPMPPSPPSTPPIRLGAVHWSNGGVHLATKRVPAGLAGQLSLVDIYTSSSSSSLSSSSTASSSAVPSSRIEFDDEVVILPSSNDTIQQQQQQQEQQQFVQSTTFLCWCADELLRRSGSFSENGSSISSASSMLASTSMPLVLRVPIDDIVSLRICQPAHSALVALCRCAHFCAANCLRFCSNWAAQKSCWTRCSDLCRLPRPPMTAISLFARIRTTISSVARSRSFRFVAVVSRSTIRSLCRPLARSSTRVATSCSSISRAPPSRRRLPSAAPSPEEVGVVSRRLGRAIAPQGGARRHGHRARRLCARRRGIGALPAAALSPRRRDAPHALVVDCRRARARPLGRAAAHLLGAAVDVRRRRQVLRCDADACATVRILCWCGARRRRRAVGRRRRRSVADV